jgi:hypothetical protein
MNIKIEYRIERNDYISFFRLFLKNIFIKRLVIIVLFCLLLAASLGTGAQWWKFVAAFIISFGVLSFIFYYAPLWFAIRRYNNDALKEPSYNENKTLTVTEEGLEIVSKSKTTNWNWVGIRKADSVGQFIYLQLADKKTYVLPKKYFSSDSEAINFLGFVQNKLTQTHGIRYKTKGNSTPPYGLGWLGIIPLVGGIVGFALVLYGIFKYKDKKLVFIGAAGIAFTVSIYSSLFYFGFKSDVGKQGFVTIAQSELNGLMKSVEFYKLKNGVYPDSLAQVNKDEEFISISDPVQMGNTQYNYKKVGNKYYLYSSGVDGIPGTKDDLYPIMAIADSSKFGLIHR